MSGKLVGWAFDQREKLTSNERYVLVALADNASHVGKCWPSKREVIDKTGLSRASVYRAWSKLTTLGLIQEGTDDGRECIWLRFGDEEDSEAEDGPESASHTETVPSQAETPKSQPETSKSHRETPYIEEPSFEPSRNLSPKPPNRKTIDRIPISDIEQTLLDSIIETFNSENGTSVTATANAVPIVKRCREHPELDLTAHAGIIATIAAGKHFWGDGKPGPAVVYGNAAQFERCIEGWRGSKVWRLQPSTETEIRPAPADPPGPKTTSDPQKAWIKIGDELVNARAIPTGTRELWLDTAKAVEIDSEHRLIVECDQPGYVAKRWRPELADAAEWIGLGLVLRYSAAREKAA